MIQSQILVAVVLVGAMGLFLSGRLRHDIVAMLALISCVLLGLVPANEAFNGFGHPAVITVAAVLILSRALSASGAVEWVLNHIGPLTRTTQGHAGALSTIAATLSAFMNNVGTLAMLLPVALQSAARAKRSPAALLMPMSFGSILGGLVTLIGTPPNVIIASFRGTAEGTPFGFFDFTPVGIVVAITGVLFVALIGWRLIPEARRGKISAQALFDIEDYVAEVQVPRGSEAVGVAFPELESDEQIDLQIVGLIRRKVRKLQGLQRESAKAGDLLIVEGSPAALDAFSAKWGLKLADAGAPESRGKLLVSDDVAVAEAAVPPRSRADGRQMRNLQFGPRHGVRLLAVSRQGRPIRDSLRHLRLRAGDVLLLQGGPERLSEAVQHLGLLPLQARDWQMGKRPQARLAALVFAISVIVTASGLMPAAVAMSAGALIIVIARVVPPREVYDAIDWPVIVLLGAMIPVAGAMESTGVTDLVAQAIVTVSGWTDGAWLAVTLLLVVTMTLSDLMNNAATAVVMAPISVGIARAMDASPDPFLMAVALGASCAFLTPIGHQNNTLIMGPGGYAFGDYWRMGLPLELLICAVGIPSILWFWPPFAG